MPQIQLVPHNVRYAQRIFEMSVAPQVKDVLGLPVEKMEDTLDFITHILNEEAAGRVLSRVILNELAEPIGITTLQFIDRQKKRCHIGSWLGHSYWGKGYNQAAKLAILQLAFEELGMEYVFAGARQINIRSQKAQEKLPYITLNVESQFPEELEFLEKKENQPCVLHVFTRDKFLSYLATERSK